MNFVKCDIKVFFLLLVHGEDFKLLGFVFKGQYYMDQVLVIGRSVSYAVFEKISTFLEWVL